MLERKTLIDQIEVRETCVQIRLGLLIVDGDQELQRTWHRTAIEADTDVDAQIAAVNTHLATMGCEPVPEAGLVRIKAIVAAAALPRPLAR